MLTLLLESLCLDRNTNTRFWGKSGNFPSLLNLETQVREYGSVRWYWDGLRERYIQMVKVELEAMRKTAKFFKSKLLKIHRRDVRDWIRRMIGRKRERRRYNNNYYHRMPASEFTLDFEFLIIEVQWELTGNGEVGRQVHI